MIKRTTNTTTIYSSNNNGRVLYVVSNSSIFLFSAFSISRPTSGFVVFVAWYSILEPC